MDVGAIAAVSMQMGMDKAAMQLELAVLKKAMAIETALAVQLLRGFQDVVPPQTAPFGHKLDAWV